MPTPGEKSYEDLKNNESVQSDTNLQNLIKQIDEIKDTKKDNDKIEWVFTDTTEWQTVEKSLNQWLKESLYQNPDISQTLADEINKLLKNPNLQLNDDIRDSLISLWNLLNWILNDFIIPNDTSNNPDTSENDEDDSDETYTEEDFIIPDDTTDNPKTPENEALDESPASLEFLDSLSKDEIIDIGKIKKDLMKEENWKKYTIIKWKRFYLDESWHEVYDYNNGNNLIIDSGKITLWNKNCFLFFKREYNEIYIYNWREDADIIKFSDWQIIRVYENKDGIFRSSNGIDVRTKRATWEHLLYSNNNSVISLNIRIAQDAFLQITSILSRIKDSKEQCKILDEHTLQVWDTDYEFPAGLKINDIAKWINNYYN